MKQWPVQDAKAHFSEMLDLCLEEGPQLVLRRGEAKAVLVPLPEWEALQKRARPSLKALLLADEPRVDLELPERTEWRFREPADFD
ncbi:MAG TPA: type II toxin-antitoxin system Phd/YefM family antitoxin [Ensifer sp.]|nr:type II toxin-antitoxin system Phd/YefM family antitoxin [Ensifer sp.]